MIKISAKMSKLSEWEKGAKWFNSRLLSNQKNNLAESLKKSTLQ